MHPAANRVVDRRRVRRIDGATTREQLDGLAVEEPLEIRVNGEPLTVTMRTPGNDFDLAIGLCLTEGITDDPTAVVTVRYCAGQDPVTRANPYNVVDVSVHGGLPPAPGLQRRLETTSACGVCGTTSIANVRKAVPDVRTDPLRISHAALAELPERLRAAQRIFDRTGGLHAAGVFSADGQLRCVREDVGRHNAVDKVIGWAAREGVLPLREHVLLVSGRVAFEIVQKALRAGLPLVAAVSAPSSLAVSLAEETGISLVGFLRGDSMNVYAGEDRIVC